MNKTKPTAHFFYLYSFERPESPTLPPEQDLPASDTSPSTAQPPHLGLPSAPSHRYLDSSVPPPPLPPGNFKKNSKGKSSFFLHLLL